MSKLLSLPFLVATISGIAMAIQGSINSSLSQKTSLISATLFVHIIGTFVALIAVLAWRTPLLKHPWNSIHGIFISVVYLALSSLDLSL